jgi:hypothetical protein
MLTDDERALLRLMEGDAELPIVQREGKWGWEFRSIRAPREFETETEARETFARYLAMLLDAERVELEQGYQVKPSNE